MNTPFYSLFNANMNPTASTAMTISINSLANGSSRQCTLIVNGYNGQNQYLPNGTGFTSVSMAANSHLARIYFSLTVGTNPTAGGNINFYLLQSDAGAPIITDGAGASDAAFTPVNAALIYSITVSAVSGLVYKGCFVIPNPGPTWGIAVQNNTGVAMNSSGNSINYVMESVQSRF